MSVNYAPSKLRVPNGFENILEGLAREVLREQPENIIGFADKYFKQKLSQRVSEEVKPTDGVDNEAAEVAPVSDATEETSPPAATEEPAPPVEETSPTEQIAAAQPTEEEEQAAVRIQSVIRGVQARKEVQALKAASSTSLVEEVIEKTDGESETVAEGETDAPAPEAEATTEAPVAEEEEEVDIDCDDPDVLAAATKIQASFRGHKARKKVEELRVAESLDVIASEGTSNTVDGGDATTGDETTTDTQVVEPEAENTVDASTENVEATEKTEATGVTEGVGNDEVVHESVEDTPAAEPEAVTES